MKILLRILSVIFLLVSLYFGFTGFDKKNIYFNSEYSNMNAYVGGDAYNYIINGTYFTGYLVISGSSLICSTVLFVGSLLIKETQKIDNRLKF